MKPGDKVLHFESESIQPDFFSKKILNLDLTFHWINDQDRFYFWRESRNGSEYVEVDAESGSQFTSSRAGAMSVERSPPSLVGAPNGLSCVFRHGYDLWLRHLPDGGEHRLTDDGEFHFGYGDVDPSYDRQSVVRRRTRSSEPLFGVQWSPDSRFIIALRQDLRGFPRRLFVTEYVAEDGGYAHAHFRKLPLARDGAAPDSRLVVIDTETMGKKEILVDKQALNDLALHYLLCGAIWWNARSKSLFLVTANRGGTRFTLNAVDLLTGHSREVLVERAQFNVRLNPLDYSHPNIYVTSDGAEIIWYSERSGYGHLYLYEVANGEVKRQLTSGEWVIFDLLRVDETQRLVYFTGATKVTGGNPYYRYLYRVSLDGGEPELLTPEIADHKFSNPLFRGSYRFAGDGVTKPPPGSSISPSGRYFIDSYSTTEQPPEYVLRRTSGELVAKVLSSDASELYDTGWRPPERIVVKSSDQTTDLYGVITRPRNFNPALKYPVIDAMYPGPQGSYAPRTFVDQLSFGAMYCTQSFADAGFIVVAVDGRGTAHRSRVFREAFLKTEDVFGAADHVAAIQQLASQRSYMDIGRVGVMGQSFGGYGSLRAMLLHAEFFKVGVSTTGPAGYLDAEGQTNVERFFGVPADSAEARGHHDVLSNLRLVSRLNGRVLLVYGGIDESVPLKHAFMVFDAFIKADKDIDMLIVPDSAHTVSKDLYVIRRTIKYFVDHLVDPKAHQG